MPLRFRKFFWSRSTPMVPGSGQRRDLIRAADLILWSGFATLMAGNSLAVTSHVFPMSAEMPIGVRIRNLCWTSGGAAQVTIAIKTADTATIRTSLFISGKQ